jgi:hypothetical protein
MKNENFEEREWQAMFVARLLKAIGKDDDLLLMAQSSMSGTTTALKILEEAIDQLKSMPVGRQFLKPNGGMLTQKMVRMIKEHQACKKYMFYDKDNTPFTFYRPELEIRATEETPSTKGVKYIVIERHGDR